MKYERQIQEHLDRFDIQLNKLYSLIKTGKQNEALKFMEEGPLKESNLGARGVQNTGTL